LRGRGFDVQDRENSSAVALVNETLAKQLWQSSNPSNPIGSRVDLANREYTVVGVAKDALNDPYAPPQPEIYLPLLQAPRSFPAVYILARTAGSPESMADTIRSRIWEIDPTQPISDVASYATLMRRRNQYGYFLTLLQASFAVLGVSLAALGIYSVLSYAVGQRTREICLRMALGAQRQEMLRLVIGQAAAPVIGGMIVGLAAAVGLAMYAKSRLPLFLFQIRETDVMTYSAVTLLLLAVAAVSAYLPARGATRLDPASVLRHD
jgi:putative ABC transport system permease protein